LKKIAVNGGPAVTLCTIVGAPGAGGGGVRGASWGVDNRIVFATNDLTTGLLRVSAGGGTPEVLTRPDPQKGEADHLWPEVLPGGRAILFTIVTSGGSPAATAPGLETAQIAVLDLSTGQQKVLVRGGSHPHYVSTGHIVYGLEGTLRAIAFDLDRLEVRSDPRPVLQGVVTKPTGAASFGVAQDGSLAYLAGSAQGIGRNALVWVDRQGREEAIAAPIRSYQYPRISPDGTKAAVDIRDEDSDIWIWDFLRATLTRFTFEPGVQGYPVWTPDGRRVAFTSEVKGALVVDWRSADGTGESEQIGASPEALYPLTFSPDGSQLVVRRVRPSASDDLYLISVIGERRLAPLRQTSFLEANGEISPDGRWLAYQSNESGRNEIYVRPFPLVDSGRWQVSSGGGSRPLWARSTQELFYVSLAGAIMRVGVDRRPSWTATTPTQVVKRGYFLAGGLTGNAGRSYDISLDGKRFLMIKEIAPDQTAAGSQIVVVQHFDEELKRLVPTR
jgi:serine/threonine-protein kinase